MRVEVGSVWDGPAAACRCVRSWWSECVVDGGGSGGGDGGGGVNGDGSCDWIVM